jgi:hypothetical protein
MIVERAREAAGGLGNTIPGVGRDIAWEFNPANASPADQSIFSFA